MKWYNPWSWFPFTHEGRQTLVYLIFAGAGPVLCIMTMLAMLMALDYKLYKTFSQLSWVVAICLLITITGLSMFVAIRSLKINKDGFSAEGGENLKSGDTVTMEKTDD